MLSYDAVCPAFKRRDLTESPCKESRHWGWIGSGAYPAFPLRQSPPSESLRPSYPALPLRQSVLLCTHPSNQMVCISSSRRTNLSKWKDEPCLPPSVGKLVMLCDWGHPDYVKSRNQPYITLNGADSLAGARGVCNEGVDFPDKNAGDTKTLLPSHLI